MLTLLGLTPFIRIERSGVNTWQIQNNNNVGTITGFSINNVSAGTTPFFINQDTGNLLLGATADAGFKLDVNGTGRFSPASSSSSSPTLMLNHASLYANIAGAGDMYHGLILRGIPAAAGDYSVTPGDEMSFYEYGGIFNFYKKQSGVLLRQFYIDNGNAYGAAFIPTGSTIPTNGMYLPSANTIAFSTNTTQRISVSSAGEVQLKQSSNSAQNSVIFNTTIQNAMTLNSSGFLILNGTTGSSRITCYGDGYFSGGIQTGNPYGSTSANWLLGRFLTETTSANGSIRVQIGSKYYNIAAEDLGTVPT
jgi:hypothetical protein